MLFLFIYSTNDCLQVTTTVTMTPHHPVSVFDQPPRFYNNHTPFEQLQPSTTPMTSTSTIAAAMATTTDNDYDE
jgi:hypothetical protein